jgi:hypothetical protein
VETKSLIASLEAHNQIQEEVRDREAAIFMVSVNYEGNVIHELRQENIFLRQTIN